MLIVSLVCRRGTRRASGHCVARSRRHSSLCYPTWWEWSSRLTGAVTSPAPSRRHGLIHRWSRSLSLLIKTCLGRWWSLHQDDHRSRSSTMCWTPLQVSRGETPGPGRWLMWQWYGGRPVASLRISCSVWVTPVCTGELIIVILTCHHLLTSYEVQLLSLLMLCYEEVLFMELLLYKT